MSNKENKGTICFVSLEIYPTTAGGVGILLRHTISFLLEAGYQVILLLDIPRLEFEQYRYTDRMDLSNGSNLNVYSVEELSEGYIFPNNAIPHSEMIRSARIAVATEKLCRKYPIELVEFYDYCGPAYYFLGNDLANPPAIAVRLHNTIEIIARKIRSEFSGERVSQFSAERLSMLGADLILSPGQNFWTEEMLPLYPEISNTPMQVSPPIHRPVGTINYSSLSRNIAFYGRLSTFKGLDTFLKGAVIALRDPKFARWVGKFIIMGPEETVASTYSLDEMKAFIPDGLQNRFLFTGRVSHIDLMERLKSVAFACFANRMESFCYAAHELHTAGVPLVLSETAAFQDHFVDGESAVFFDTTPMGLGRKMVELAQNTNARLRLSQFGKARGPSYLVDHYASHLDVVRHLPNPVGGQVDVVIMVLANGRGPALEKTLLSLREKASHIYVLQLDDHGEFRFATFNWRLETIGELRVDPLVAMASDAIIMIRAGDVLDSGWLGQATRVMARRTNVGAICGWIVDGNQLFDHQLLMQETGLLPEAVMLREPGLRALIRTNAMQLLQDALMLRPGITESALMLEKRSEGKLTLTLPRASCDVTDAIALPAPQRALLIRHEFDRINKDYMTGLILEQERNSGRAGQETDRLLAQSGTEKGFVYIRTASRDELGEAGGSEILFLRIFPDPKGGAAPWSAMQFNGDWTVRLDPGGPIAGAMRTEKGSAQAYVRSGAVIDVLKSPWSGGIEIFYAGKSTIIDLYSAKTDVVRLIFTEKGIQVRNVLGQVNANENTLPALKLPACFVTSGKCDTIFITLGNEDFASWPAPHDIAHRSIRFEDSLLQRTGGEDSPLGQAISNMDVKRVVFSSRLPCSPQIAQLLATLPERTEIGLALCGAHPSNPEVSSPMAQIAAWYNLLTPWFARLTVLGAANGLLDTFAFAGAQVVRVPLLQVVPFEAALLGKAAPVSIALVDGELWPENLMHMVAAVLLATEAGLNVSILFLPESFRASARIFDEVPMPVPVGFYRDAAGLAFVGNGTRRIAIGSYPQELMPHDLRVVAALGWLPLTGAVCDFDDASPEIANALTEPFWENGTKLADRLIAIAADYDDLWIRFAAFAAISHQAGAETFQKFLVSGSHRTNASAPILSREITA